MATDKNIKRIIEKKARMIFVGMIFLALTLNFISSVIVDADYVTLYPGEEERVSLNVENNENFDIEDVSISLDLSKVPFTSVGSSVKDVDNLDEDDDDSVTFTLRPSTDVVPGDYDIPYIVKYSNAQNNSEVFSENGSFGIRVSARTDLDFSAETRETAMLGKEGQISLEIINKGLGEVKSVSVEVFPQGFELLSANKAFIGTIDSDDSDIATFDVVYKSKNPVFSAKISYKDFDNNDKEETISLPLKAYTEEEAVKLGLMSKSRTGLYAGTAVVLLVLWYVWRKIRRINRQKERKNMMGR